MIKSALKTLSFAFVTLGFAVASPAAEQGPSLHFASMSIESAASSCSPQAVIDLGWEYQQALLEERLALRSEGELKVPGAIISPPFASFPPYRKDDPTTAEPRRTSKRANTSASHSAGRASVARRM